MKVPVNNKRDKIFRVALESAVLRPDTLREDGESTVVDLIWYTGSTVVRVDYDGHYYLRMDMEGVDLSRLNNGAPLLSDHCMATNAVVGIVVPGSAKVENGLCVATVKLYKTKTDKEKFPPDSTAEVVDKIEAGIIRNVSVGFTILDYKEVEEVVDGEQTTVVLATRWQPFEISAVPVGADPGAVFLALEGTNMDEEGVKGVPEEQPEEPKKTIETINVTNMNVEIFKVKEKEEEKEEDKPSEAPKEGPVETLSLRREQERVDYILGFAQKIGVDQQHAFSLIHSGAKERDAQKKLVEVAMGKNTHVSSLHIGKEDRDHMVDGMEEALMYRSRPKEIKGAGRKYIGMSLLRMGEDFLRVNGVEFSGKRELARKMLQRFSNHATGDFPLILQNVAERTLQGAYTEHPQTFKAWTRQSNLPDFKTKRVVSLGEMPTLRPVAEGGEYKHVSMGEHGEEWNISKYGEIFSITSEALINDDLDAFTRIPALFGDAAARRESDIVYGVLLNSPAMSDGIPLFDAGHANISPNAGPITPARISEMNLLMRNQMGIDQRARIGVPASFILTSASNEFALEQLMSSAYYPDRPDGVVTPSQKGLTVITDTHIDDLDPDLWYMIADPSAMDTIVYGWLEGAEGPQLDREEGFNVDAVNYKVTLYFGAAALEYRGMVRNDG